MSITTEQIQEIYSHFISSKGVTTDTRKIENGQLFFALKGPNFNGNKYAQQAIEKGASLAIIDEPEQAHNPQTFLVEDVLESLQELARHHRHQLKIPVIAITGSNGKTTTKELVKSVLSTTFKTFATHGNLNNHIGVPLSLLSITQEHQMAIIEMGANHQTEINQLCRIAEPNFGLITNIGLAHLEGFGGPEGVKKGKGELFEFLDAFGGRAFVNMNDDAIAEIAYFMQKATTYGTGKFYNTNGIIASPSPFLKVSWEPRKSKHKQPISEPLLIQTQLTGAYNLDNVLAAIAVGTRFKLTAESIKKGIEEYAPTNNRSQVVEQDGNTFIYDFYNANPSSMTAALNNLKLLFNTKKIAILGDMLELGAFAKEEHQKIADLAIQNEIDVLVLVGPYFGETNKSGNTFHFKDSQMAKEWFDTQSFANAAILIKGSRSLKMERIVE